MPQKFYNHDWFQNRALTSLKHIEPGVWDYSDSLLLYTPKGSDTYEQLQVTDTPYNKLVTAPEREYLKAIAKDVVAQLPDHFYFIDLGPGTEHKEQFFFDELKEQGKTFVYVPVDISDQFLDIAEQHAVEQGIQVQRVKASFEELRELLSDELTPRFASLGLTFSNYDPDVAIELVQNIAGPNGYAFINTQIRNRTDMQALQAVYQEDATALANEKLQLLGLDPQKDVSPRSADNGFRVWCSVEHSNDKLREVGVEDGDKLLVFQSLRYTKDQLEALLAHVSHQLFDTGESFIGALIRT